MSLLQRIAFYLHLADSSRIARRYFVVNGFDGALAMLGIILGFYTAENIGLDVVISACLGASIALGISGFSSAYISEVAERKQALDTLQQAMISDLQRSAHGHASRIAPLWIATVNGAAPLLIALLIMLPLWLAQGTAFSANQALSAAIGVTLLLIFLLGVFLGKISTTFWLWAGLRALLVAAVTASLVLAVTGS
jgi:predicted membrane protein (TIGR00267 family)